MNDNYVCSHCGCTIEDEGEVFEVQGQIFCEDCYNDETFTCDHCGERFLYSNSVSDENIAICTDCYDNFYRRCERCNCLLNDNDVYWLGDYPYCRDCYDDETEDNFIHDYYYKPTPIFYKCSDEEKVRYYGVELEIDRGGKDDDNAEEIHNTANYQNELLYIKSDGSLNDGMELVSHPCSMKYHRYEFPWADIMRRSVQLGYRSHNTTTCGLHVHIGRNELGETYEIQEDVISRIMFFFESHWNELFRFSRRSEESAEHWAARHGYNDRPKEILEKAKKSSKGRYACVNITNANTVEIRLFRGTLKWNTFMATIELVDEICRNAVCLDDKEIHKQSWSDFVMGIDQSKIELVKYLKEKRLYVNEPVEAEEEN